MDRPIGAKAVAYLRVSKGEQQLGPEAQRAAITRFAQRERIQIVHWHEDTGERGARSGWLPVSRRPALGRAIGDIQTGVASLLLVDVRDRLGRKLRDLLSIEAEVCAAGGWILSACGTGNGCSDMHVLARHISYVFADAERRRISARIHAVFDVKRGQNQVTGIPPIGLRVGPGKRLEIEPKECEVLFAVASLRRRGFGLGSIQRELTRCGVFGRRGRPITDHTLRRICDRLRLVANVPPAGPFPCRHVELQRPIVYNIYRRALSLSNRIFPSSSRASQPPRPTMSRGLGPIVRRKKQAPQWC